MRGDLRRAAETVQDAAELAVGPLVFEEAKGVVPGLAAVNDDGQVKAAGALELLAEDLLLNVARRVVVMVVESDFTPGQQAPLPGARGELVQQLIGGVAGFVGMDAGGHPEKAVVLGRQQQSLLDVGGACGFGEGEDAGDASLVGAREHGIAVGVELRVVEVRVRVGEAHDYFSRAPTGTSSLKVTSTGRPWSPTEAATIMPLDSRPRIFRGWRLVTMTTFLPTSWSGA